MSVKISWHFQIQARAVYEPSTGPGVPGQHFRRDLPPGAAELSEANGQPYLTYVCPCGCGNVGVLPLAPFPGRAGWDWDADRVNPVLRPSIRHRYGCRWHGFLGGADGKQPGIWETCADSGGG